MSSKDRPEGRREFGVRQPDEHISLHSQQPKYVEFSIQPAKPTKETLQAAPPKPKKGD